MTAQVTKRRRKTFPWADIDDLGPPPKKWADADETQVTEEWQDWVNAATINAAFNSGQDPSTYVPEAYDKAIPDDGTWIIVIDVPHTALPFDVPVLSMWRARRESASCGRLALGKVGRDVIYSRPPQKAAILTPGGELHLWPFEYQLIDDITPFVGETGCTMHTLGGDPVLPNDDERLFYLMSRGITRHDAALLLLNDVTSLDFAYFTFDDDIVEVFRGVGVPLWRHMALNPRGERP